MEIYELLFVCALVVFLVMTLCALIPVCIVTRKRSSANTELSPATERIISFCNCMAGGVFIAMCFLGLIPYARDKTHMALVLLEVKTDFPLAESIMMLGFFLIMTCEKIILHCQKSGRRKLEPHSARHNTESRMEKTNQQSRAGAGKPSQYYCSEEDESAVNLLTDTNNLEVITPDSPSVTFSTSNQKATQNVYQNVPLAVPDSMKLEPLGKVHSQSCSQHLNQALEQPRGLLQLVVLYLAIGIHSLFEGMALGLQTDQMRIFHLFFAIVFHEALVSFSVGVTLARRVTSLKRSLKYVLLFTISVPLGIGLGLVIQQAPGIGGSVASAILQCLSAGIFIHVTFMELVPAELASESDALPKVVFHFLGFFALAVITAVMGSHH